MGPFIIIETIQLRFMSPCSCMTAAAPVTFVVITCRQLRDVGRSVSAYGFWADILNGPYHAFGTVADDPRLFKITNKQFVHTAVDVAEHNLLVGCSDSWLCACMLADCAVVHGRRHVCAQCCGHARVVG
jgi:hypothetical protein